MQTLLMHEMCETHMREYSRKRFSYFRHADELYARICTRNARIGPSVPVLEAMWVCFEADEMRVGGVRRKRASPIVLRVFHDARLLLSGNPLEGL